MLTTVAFWVFFFLKKESEDHFFLILKTTPALTENSGEMGKYSHLLPVTFSQICTAPWR
jgi:hypothetical protein